MSIGLTLSVASGWAPRPPARIEVGNLKVFSLKLSIYVKSKSNGWALIRLNICDNFKFDGELNFDQLNELKVMLNQKQAIEESIKGIEEKLGNN